MKTAAIWLLFAGALCFVLRAAVLDGRLSDESRAEAPRWKVATAPWRHLDGNLYSQAGNRLRRAYLRAMGCAVLLLLLALIVNHL